MIPTVPLDDPDAERAVLGCAIASSHGAQLAGERLDPSDFYDPVRARLFEVALGLPDELRQDDRIELVTEITGRFWAEVVELVESRPVMFDRSGSFASRVLTAAERRRQARRRLDELSALGFTVEMES